MPYLEGDSTLTIRQVLDRGWHLKIACGRPGCYSISPALRLAPWPRYYDVPILKLYDRLKCEKYGHPAVEVTVWRFTGKGSQMEEVLRLAERLE